MISETSYSYIMDLACMLDPRLINNTKLLENFCKFFILKIFRFVAIGSSRDLYIQEKKKQTKQNGHSNPLPLAQSTPTSADPAAVSRTAPTSTAAAADPAVSPRLAALRLRLPPAPRRLPPIPTVAAPSLPHLHRRCADPSSCCLDPS